ncbi:hypothetical protein ABT131_24065 [Streptomyces sp900105245]|uniref:Uncharacterized protein n=1 Tax=Streptomyces sp. 900105245 TaxID=3154379 RepID=A0ABV1U1Y1_9ACTN
MARTGIEAALNDLLFDRALTLQEGADRHVTPEYRRHAYGRFSRIEETTLMLQGSGSDRDLGSAR